MARSGSKLRVNRRVKMTSVVGCSDGAAPVLVPGTAAAAPRDDGLRRIFPSNGAILVNSTADGATTS